MNALVVVYLLIVSFVIVVNIADIDPLSRLFIYCWGLIMKYAGLARLARWTNRHHPNG